MGGYQNYTSGDDIYQKIKGDILSLELKPGQMISENEIANRYNVSRTPVKNAFLRLKGEKYIEIVPQKGSFVTLLDIKYVKDIIYMRSVLELDAVNTIIDSGRADDVFALLQENLWKQIRLTESGEANPSIFYDIDSDFHFTFFKEAGREKMWDVIQDCQVYYMRFRMLDTVTTARYSDLCHEHMAIARALKAKDLAKLKTCIFNHLEGNVRVLASKIEGEYRDYFVQEQDM